MEIECLRTCEATCHLRAALAFPSEAAEKWSRLATWNREQREKRERELAAVK